MTSIDAAARLAAIVRAQIDAVQNARARPQPAGPRGRAGNPAVQPSASDFDVTQAAVEQIRGIPFDHPQRRQQALRAFLQAVLAAQFGPELLGDPQLVQMLDHVQQQFEADERLKQVADEAADVLLAAAAQPPGSA